MGINLYLQHVLKVDRFHTTPISTTKTSGGRDFMRELSCTLARGVMLFTFIAENPHLIGR